MYLNVISFKNGKTLQFQTVVPYSVDKVKEPTPADQYGDWNLVTDEVNGQTLSFRGSEIVTIASMSIETTEERQAKRRKRTVKDLNKVPSIKTGVTKE